MSDTATSRRAKVAPRVAWRHAARRLRRGDLLHSLGYMIMVVVPPWVVTLHAARPWSAMILGSRHFLALLYSIHGGAMMDGLDVRRVMMSSRSSASRCRSSTRCCPTSAPTIVLQMIAGL